MSKEFTDENGAIHRTDGTLWVSDGGKRDNWETFEDCHTQVSPALDSGIIVPLIVVSVIVVIASALYFALR